MPMSDQYQSLSFKWKVEIIAILITFVFTALILLPIMQNSPDFPFMVFNIAAIVIFITLIRYLFLLRFTPLARFMPLKVVIVFLSIPLLVYLIDGLAEFQFELDEEGTYSMVSHLDVNKQLPLSKYIRSEMIFFTTGAIIGTLLLPIRMIISIWKVKNRNTV